MTIKFSADKVKELMTPDPVLIDPGSTLQEAARRMEDIDCGVLPVGTDRKLEGMITDRDIVIRAVARGKDPAREKVADYMTTSVHSCNENDTLEDAAEKMHQYRVSRLVVENAEGKVTGILSFGRFLRTDATPREIAACIRNAVNEA